MPDNEYPADIIDLPYADDPELARIKMLPHSIEAEQSVLGGLLLSDEAWDNVAEVVSFGDFYRPDHRLIFKQMAKLADTSEPIGCKWFALFPPFFLRAASVIRIEKLRINREAKKFAMTIKECGRCFSTATIVDSVSR